MEGWVFRDGALHHLKDEIPRGWTRGSTPGFIDRRQEAAAREVAEFDLLMSRKVKHMPPSKLKNIDLVVGIPFYTEISNIISVLVTLREVFQERRQRCLLCVVGECARSDVVQMIDATEIEEGESSEHERLRAALKRKGSMTDQVVSVSIQKPWTVRALQLVAAEANDGHGAHLLVVDADIQFNHWELSANSLVTALLNPLLIHDKLTKNPSSSSKETISSTATDSVHYPSSPSCADPPSATMVVLNAPRSFIADDGLVHLFSFLFVYAALGIKIHQIYGGEFSVHRELNKKLLLDRTLFYRDSYCMECQFACRAVLDTAAEDEKAAQEADEDEKEGQEGQPEAPTLHESKDGVLEWLMKGKWHAKITLSKLLTIDSKSEKTRLDFVTEKLFDDVLFLSSQGIGSDDSLQKRVHSGTGGLSKRQHPDPRLQSMRVLAPTATRKELLTASKAYYERLLTNHLTQGAADLPLDSSFVQEFLPQLHTRAWRQRKGRESYSLIVARANPDWTAEEREIHLVFGPEEWAKHLVGLLQIYRDSTDEKQRRAVLEANRLVWMIGAIAFLNDCVFGSWGEMLNLMHQEYAPVFRRAYLHDFLVCPSSPS